MKNMVSKKQLIGLSFIICHLFSAALVSCSNNDDWEDPAIRVSETMQTYESVLKGAANGWVMAYYGNTDFGGFNVLCKFGENNQVTIANEFFGTDTTAVSHYKLEQSGGIILSFDEYNELFHFFADPINPEGFGYGTSDGFGGDMEFRVVTATTDSVVLRGKKHGARVVLTPMAQGMKWSDYLTKVKEVATVMQRGYYHMVAGKDSLRMKADKIYRTMTYRTTNEEGEALTVIAPYIVTAQGISFYEPVEFAGKTVKGFAYKPSATTYEQLDGGGVTLAKFVAPVNEQLLDGEWYITSEGLGTYASRYWKRFCNFMLSEYDLKIYYAYLGSMRNYFGLSVGPVSATSPDGIYTAECRFDYELEGDDIIKIWFDEESFDDIGNGEVFYFEGGHLDYAVLPFASTDQSRPRVFKVETDNINMPTYIRLIDQEEENNVITLYPEETYYPFGE